MRRQQWRSWYIYFLQLPIAPDLLSKLFPRLVKRLAYRAGGLGETNRPDVTRGDHSISQAINQYRAFAREIPKAFTQKLPRLRPPVLVIWGNRDPFLLPPTQDELELYAQSLTIRILEGSHWVYRESPNEVNLLLERFFTVSEAKRVKSSAKNNDSRLAG